MAECSDERAIWIARVDGDARYPTTVLQADALPRRAFVGGAIHAPAHRDVAAQKAFPGSCPDDAWVRRRYRKRANR